MASNISLSLRSALEKDNGTNFIDACWNLRSVLKQEKKLEVPNQALPNELEMFQEHARHERFITTKALLVRKGKGKGGKGKGKPNPKDKLGLGSKGKGLMMPKPNPQKEGMCFHCNNDVHWKGKCPLYLEELKKNGRGFHFRYLSHRGQSLYFNIMGIGYRMWFSHLFKCTRTKK